MVNAAAAVPTSASQRKRSALVPLLAAGFILTGFPTVIAGPVLPVFISRWGLTDSQAGLFFTVQFAAALAAVWITTGLTAWRGYRPGLVIGYAVTGVGLALLNAPTQAIALIAVALFGMGYGLVVPPTNLAGAEVGGAGVVSLLNFAWGIGAVACAPLVSIALRMHSLTGLLVALGFCGFVLATAFLFVPIPSKHPAEVDSSALARIPLPPISVTVVVAAIFFLYVGTEASIGGWAAEDAKRLEGHATALTTMTPLFFYAGIMVARGLGSLLLTRVGSLRVVVVAFALTIAGTLVVMAAHGTHLAIAGFSIAGLGCASIYPIFISWLSQWYGPAARKLGGVAFSMASLGGAAMPLLVGFVSTKTASLRVGLGVPLIGAVLMVVLVWILRRRGMAMV
jgi:FHS family glucose/mannose:H+ symporter-like MFS transporter